MNSSPFTTRLRCDHCGEFCNDAEIYLGDKMFCCEGCKSVYQILSTPELCSYYTINAHPGRPQSEPFRSDKFEYLDNPEIAAKVIQFTNGLQTHVTFFLPQIHCSSCLWLLEHLTRIDSGIMSSSVSFENKEVFITFRPNITSLRKIVEMLTRIGYEPHLSPGELSMQRQVEPRRKHWYKIGLAGFCFSNIMMWSLPEYFAGPEGIETDISQLINLLKVVLAIPVITYAASGFFIQAWKGLRERYLNIDVPIALALVITFGRSLYEIGSGTGAGYLDSMSGIVFFMLIGRWLQDLTYRAISFDRDFKSFFPIAVQVIQNDKIAQVPIENLKVNDIIRIHHGELIPVDAMLSKGNAQIDYSFVTGESIPVSVDKGTLVYAGGKQTGGRIDLIVVKEASQSYLTQLWNRNDPNQNNSRTHPFIDSLSRYFTYIIFGIGIASASYWWVHSQTGLMWNALTTILIVACPCALLLAANFTTGNILRILSNNRFYLKNARVLETLSNVNSILFDKTGTLTYKSKMQVSYEGALLDPRMKNEIAQLLIHSNHPLSKAIFHYLDTQPDRSAEHFKMTPGEGIEGWIEERHIKIGSPQFVGVKGLDHQSTVSCVSINQQFIGTFTIHPEYRPGLSRMFDKLKERYSIALLSGDQDAEKETLANQMGRDCDIRFNQRPEDKMQYISNLQRDPDTRVLMIGDGLNDVPALHQSHVGIAVSEGDNAFAPAADGIIEASHLSILDRILAYIRAGRLIILLSFGISIVYNLAGLYFAVQGTLSPLIAAILMPMSSITIILITYGLSNYMARRYHLNLNHPTS